ncbi:hypothetical protein TorRG33x02_264740 [Trema orientale]|uniref:CCHC-type domain-containing protein n=1 Tax=Trema orientale TaxID=63057 RepID=A0A2P5D2B9_TREOI|nr:hypothetical protein TorRG33x02_264740 [Trema orientale]
MAINTLWIFSIVSLLSKISASVWRFQRRDALSMLIVSRLHGNASTWLEQLQISRYREGRHPNDLSETESQQVARYISGLKDAIFDQMTLKTIWTLFVVVNLDVPKPPPNSQKANIYAHPALGKYYCCNQPGHHLNECPQQQQNALIDRLDETLEPYDEYNEEAYLLPDKGEVISCIIEMLLLTSILPPPSQCHSLFKTHCTIDKNMCEVIIYSGNTENIISRALVKALGQPIKKHSHPYKVGWIKKKMESQVSEICCVSFTIDKLYQDEVTTSYMLFYLRPWAQIAIRLHLRRFALEKVCFILNVQ